MLAGNTWKRRILGVQLVPWPRLGAEIREENKSCVLLVVDVKELHLERKEAAAVGQEERLSFNGSEHHLEAEEAVEVASQVELLEEG